MVESGLTSICSGMRCEGQCAWRFTAKSVVFKRRRQNNSAVYWSFFYLSYDSEEFRQIRGFAYEK